MSQEDHLLEMETKRLKIEKEEKEAALPAHSLRPNQFIAIADWENKISCKEAQLLIQKKTVRSLNF
jgi:hypothetical protein